MKVLAKSIFIHYYELTYILYGDEDFYKQYIISIDTRIKEIYYKGSYLNIITTNEDFIEELDCRYNLKVR